MFPSFSPELDDLERSVSVKMIDFAHVWPAEVGAEFNKNIFSSFLVFGDSLKQNAMPRILSSLNAVLKKTTAAHILQPFQASNVQDEFPTNVLF